MAFANQSITEIKNQCYDIAMDCDCETNCPKIQVNDCGLHFSNSVRNQIFIILGSCPNNWMGFPFVNWELIRSAPLNSFGVNNIEAELTRAMNSIIDQIDIQVEFAKNCFTIRINITEENFSISSTNTCCFLDVINPDHVFNTVT